MIKNILFSILIVCLPFCIFSDKDRIIETDLIKKLTENIVVNHKPEDFNTYAQLYLVKWLNETPHSIINNFIKYADKDLIESERIIKKAVEWRRLNQMESILDWNPPKFIKNNFPYCTSKSNYKNKYSIVIPFEKWDIENAIKKGYRDHLLKYSLQIVEIFLKKNIEIGHNDIMIDFTDFSYQQIFSIKGVSFVYILMEIFNEVYPNHNSFYTEQVPLFARFFHFVFGIPNKSL